MAAEQCMGNCSKLCAGAVWWALILASDVMATLREDTCILIQACACASVRGGVYVYMNSVSEGNRCGYW
jgi:hypothetical protein